jgi:hypothetical protein
MHACVEEAEKGAKLIRIQNSTDSRPLLERLLHVPVRKRVLLGKKEKKGRSYQERAQVAL